MLESHKLVSVARARALALSGYSQASWYDKAEQEIKLVSALAGWNKQEFSDTLAILSPRVTVRRNVRATLAYFGQGRVHFATTMRNVRKSLRNYQESGIIGGNKVPFFARALSGDKESITLDSWMALALLDCQEPSIKQFTRKATHEQADKLVVKVGKQVGLCPRDCQAAIWCGIYRESGSIPPWYPIIEEYERWLAYDSNFPLSGTIGEPEIGEVTASGWIDSILAEQEQEFL